MHGACEIELTNEGRGGIQHFLALDAARVAEEGKGSWFENAFIVKRNGVSSLSFLLQDAFVELPSPLQRASQEALCIPEWMTYWYGSWQTRRRLPSHTLVPKNFVFAVLQQIESVRLQGILLGPPYSPCLRMSARLKHG